MTSGRWISSAVALAAAGMLLASTPSYPAQATDSLTPGDAATRVIDLKHGWPSRASRSIFRIAS
jgi:hypothetical protein